MSMREHQFDHAQCRALAAGMLGASVRAVVLDREMETVLRRRAKLEARQGWTCAPAIVRFKSGDRGHELALGAERYRVATGEGWLRIVRVVAPRICYSADEAYEFWGVAERDYRRLYGLLRRAVRR